MLRTNYALGKYRCWISWLVGFGCNHGIWKFLGQGSNTIAVTTLDLLNAGHPGTSRSWDLGLAVPIGLRGHGILTIDPAKGDGGPHTAQKPDTPRLKAWLSYFLIQQDPWKGGQRFCSYLLLGVLCFAHSSLSINIVQCMNR